MTRVAGHTLAHEGAPHVITERGDVQRVSRQYGGVGGVGRALCSCGQLSPFLSSAYRRKQWHREHKAAVSA